MGTRNAKLLWPENTQRKASDSDWFRVQVMERYELSGKSGGMPDFLGRKAWPSGAHYNDGWADHCKVFYSKRRAVLMTAEPYGLDGEGLANLNRFANEHDLRVSIRAESAHYFGWTILILLWKRAEYERLYRTHGDLKP